MAEGILIKPGSLKGSIKAIASKTYGHRMIILSALSKKSSKLILEEYNDDLFATLDCIKNLGGDYSIDKDELIIEPIEKGSKDISLNCRESGSTLRFIIPVATALYDKTLIDGTGTLGKRPIKPLLQALSQRGVEFSRETLPIVSKGKFHGGKIYLPGNISSQFITGILLASSILEEDTTIELTTPLESVAYVKVTLEVLKDYAIEVLEKNDGYYIKGGQKPNPPVQNKVQGDWSNAAAFLVAGAINGNLTMEGLLVSSSQGDKIILEILENFGADLKIEDEISIKSKGKRPIEMDINECPDLLPVLGILGCSVKGVSKFTNGGRLRIKESDRLNNTMDLINSLGGKAEVLGDDLIVYGSGSLKGGVVSSYNDHRMVMAATIASTIAEEDIVIYGHKAINKSYPKFFEDFNNLGGNFIEFDHRK